MSYSWKFLNLEGHTHVKNPFILRCHRHIDLDLIVEVMLTTMKRKLSMSVAMI
jgi:hypothetical protein